MKIEDIKSGSELKDKIIYTSIELFSSIGIKSVSTDMIALECGISKKTLYEVFNSKEELIQAIINWSLKQMDDFWETIINRIENDPTADFTEVFHQLMLKVNILITIFTKPFLVDLKRFYPSLWSFIREFRTKKMAIYFGRLFEFGQQTGYVRKDVDAKLAFYIHLFVLDNILTPEVISDLSMNTNEILDNIFKILFTGLLTEKGKENSKMFHKLQQKEE